MPIIHVSERDGLAIVAFDRPSVNAIEFSLVEELDRHLVALRDDTSIRALVLTGRGPCFSAGIDIKVVPRYTDAERTRLISAINQMIAHLYGFPKPVVAAINGHAIGGGLCLALACDLRVATSDSCRLGLTEVKVGIPFPAGPMVVVQTELDCNTARILTLTGREIAPREAQSLGVVDELAGPQNLEQQACDLAMSLAGGPAYTAVKNQLRAGTVAKLNRIVDDNDDPFLRREPELA